MIKINKKILLTNAGTTVAQNVLEYSRKALAAIYGVDRNPFCYAQTVLGKNFFIAPPISAWQNYKNFLLRVCQENKIDLIIPCSNDEELIKLAESREDFSKIGTDILISNLKSILICDDKIKLSRFAANLGLKTPRIYVGGKIKYPVVIKNLRGNGSENILVAKNEQELNKINRKGRMIQEMVSGSEYSVDLVLDNNSEVIASLCRKRIAVKSGLCTKTEIIDDSPLLVLSAMIAKHLRLIGPANVQFIEDYLIEVNPRLPGGLGLDCAAGVNLALLGIKAYYNLPITQKEKTIKNHKVLRIWKEIVYGR